MAVLRSLALLFFVAALFCICGINAAPTPQIGNLTCNIDRLKTVSNLAAATSAVKKLASAAGSDDATASAAQDALTGLKSAQSGIGTIAEALVTGQQAPADARDQVGAGLTAAQTALSGITSTDPAVTSALDKANASLDKTVSAGQGVVANCK